VLGAIFLVTAYVFLAHLHYSSVGRPHVTESPGLSCIKTVLLVSKHLKYLWLSGSQADGYFFLV